MSRPSSRAASRISASEAVVMYSSRPSIIRSRRSTSLGDLSAIKVFPNFLCVALNPSGDSAVQRLRHIQFRLDGGAVLAILHAQEDQQRRFIIFEMLHDGRSEEHTSELQSLRHLVCRLLLEK